MWDSRHIFAWTVLLICGAGFLVGQFVYVSWKPRKAPFRIVLAQGALLFPAWVPPPSPASPPEKSFVLKYHPPSQPLVGLVDTDAWTLSLKFPAFLAGVWLIRCQIARSRRSRGFDVLPSSPAKNSPPAQP